LRINVLTREIVVVGDLQTVVVYPPWRCLAVSLTYHYIYFSPNIISWHSSTDSSLL
jgi:hypothetical protein